MTEPLATATAPSRRGLAAIRSDLPTSSMSIYSMSRRDLARGHGARRFRCRSQRRPTPRTGRDDQTSQERHAFAHSLCWTPSGAVLGPWFGIASPRRVTQSVAAAVDLGRRDRGPSRPFTIAVETGLRRCTRRDTATVCDSPKIRCRASYAETPRPQWDSRSTACRRARTAGRPIARPRYERSSW